MAMKPETRFRVNRVLPFLKTLKHSYFFAIQQVAISGDPDYILCMRGLFVALELKDDGETLRPLQEFKHKEVRRAKGIAITASPSTWAATKEILKALDKGDI